MSSRIQQFETATGYKFAYRLVSPLLIQKIRAMHQPPTPPMQEVTNADGSKRLEPNPDADGYAQIVLEHEANISTIVRKRVIRLSVVPWQITDEERARIDEIREVMGDDVAEESDLEIFISYEALAEVKDFQTFLQSATKGGPTDPKSPAGTPPTTSE